MQLEKGLIVVTGNGKGKTTTALGYVLRFLGQDKKVRMIQFLKGSGFSGELFTEQFFAGRFRISQFGGSCRFSEQVRAGLIKCQKCGECFRESKNPTSDWAGKAMQAVRKSLEEGYDLLVLDEVAHAIKNDLLKVGDLKEFLANAKKKALVIATGRNMHEEIIAMSDYAVECHPLKHPKDKGIDARRGVEY